MTRARLLADDLVELSVTDQATAESMAAKLRRDGDWLEVVTGIDTLTAQFDCIRIDADEALRRFDAIADASPVDTPTAEAIEIPVCYSDDMAPDLRAVCAKLALSTEELIRLHSADTHRVRLIGFAPGFAYLDGLDARLDVPRHAKPRQQVPAGSIAIAGGQTGIYSMRSPGGWQIIGRTPVRLFDASKTPPMRLEAGQTVRFRAITAEQFESMAEG